MDSPRRAVTIILIAYLFLALTYNTLTPLGEAPDEVSHFSYVRHVATTWRLPSPHGTVFGEVFQPPLYYFLAAPLTAWLPLGPLPVENNADWILGDPYRGFNRLIHPPAARWPWQGEALAWHAARFLSALLGLVTVTATAGIARCTFSNHPWAMVAATAFVAFLPQFTFLSGALNNDTLATALGALLLWQLARLLSRPDAPHAATSWMLVGLLGGLGVWAKTSGWVFAGTAGIGALLAARHVRSGERLIAARRALVPLIGTWAAVAAPWLLWNLVQYGDPLGWGLMRQVTDPRTQPLTVGELWDVALGAYRSFWAGFGGAAHRHFPPLVQGLTGALVLLAGVGLVGLWRRRKTLPAATRTLLPLWSLHLGLTLIALIQWTRTVLGTDQGRLIFPALPAIAMLLTGGWLALSGALSRRSAAGRARPVALAVSGGMVSLSLAALIVVLRPLISPPLPPLQSEATVGEWQFGDGLVLERFAFPWTVDSHLPPETSTDLYLEWGARSELPDLRVRLQLIDRDGRPVWIKEGTPSAGRDTSDEWPAGARGLPARHRVSIPAGTPPGWYRLMLSIHLAGDPAAVPILDANGDFIGDQIMIGQVTVVPAEGTS